MFTVLLVDRLPDDREIVHKLLAAHPAWEIGSADTPAEALTILEEQGAAVLLVDMAVALDDDSSFVRTVRQQHSNVPIVVMTPTANEPAVVRTLMLGAADYVPRSELARDLIATIERLLTLSGVTAHANDVLECLERHVVEFTLPNQRRRVIPIIDYFQRMMSRLQLCGPEDRVRVGTALEEALVNAIVHGNLEVQSAEREASQEQYEQKIVKRAAESPYQERHVSVRAEFTTEAATFVIRDEGPGFDIEDIPDPTDPENLMRVCGRGLLLMRAFTDELRYNQKGNEVTLVKKRSVASESAT